MSEPIPEVFGRNKLIQFLRKYLLGQAPGHETRIIAKELNSQGACAAAAAVTANSQGSDNSGIYIGDGSPYLRLYQQDDSFTLESGGTGYTSKPIQIGRPADNNNDIYIPGRVGVGTIRGTSFSNGDDEYQLMVTSSGQDHYLMFLHNGGNSYDHRGLEISCGRSSGGGVGDTDAYYIAFTENAAAGAGVTAPAGTISSEGGSVSYNTFTGVHIGTIEGFSREAYPYGTIMKVKSVTTPAERWSQPEYVCEKTTTAEDPTVIGAYRASELDSDGIPRQERFSIAALGDGHIWVCDENGDIDPGDYIVSSTVAGHGRKQADNLMRNYTVAKATEGVRWAQVSGSTKLLACTYHCG